MRLSSLKAWSKTVIVVDHTKLEAICNIDEIIHGLWAMNDT